jgi:hypothetical protein
MTKRNIVLMVVAALVLQFVLAGQVYAWVGCPTDVRFSPMQTGTLKYGAQGGMQYYPSACEFWFDFGGIGLENYQDYTLVCGTISDLICLGHGTTNGWGQIHIRECINTGDLCDLKIALVLTEDVDCVGGYMTDWEPSRYLLGKDSINYEDTCDYVDMLDESDNVKGEFSYDPVDAELCFQLKAWGLVKGEEYVLAVQPDTSIAPTVPGSLICLGSGTANYRGYVKILGCMDINQDLTDAVVGLVLKTQVDCTAGYLTPWPPTGYLVSDGTVSYDDTDVP